MEGRICELQVASGDLKHLAILPDQGILRLGENLHQGAFIQRAEGRDDRQPPHEFGNHAVFDEVFRGHLGQEFRPRVDGVLLADILGGEADALAADAALDGLFNSREGAAADEEDVRRVHLNVLLLGVLSTALGRDIRDRAFEHLEQRLLHAFAGDVARDAHVAGASGDLVDFIDVNDSALSGFEIEVGALKESEEDVLNIFADIAGLGQGRRVADRKRDIENAGEALGEQRFARTGGADEQDVALFDFDVVDLGAIGVTESLVVIMDGDGEGALGVILADDVLIEEALDLKRRRDLVEERLHAAGAPLLLLDDVVAEIDAVGTDEGVARSFDHGPDLTVRLSAETTRAGLASLDVSAGGHPAARGVVTGTAVSLRSILQGQNPFWLAVVRRSVPPCVARLLWKARDCNARQARYRPCPEAVLTSIPVAPSLR